MHKDLDYLLAYPGGNSTALVESRVERTEQPAVGSLLLAAPQIRKEQIEQVGFIEPATTKGAQARLQMASGELCLNATRSLIAFLALCDLDAVDNVIGIETSGYEIQEQPALITATTKLVGDGDVFVTLPLPLASLVEAPAHTEVLPLDGQPTPLLLVQLKGITHLVIRQADTPESLHSLLDHAHAGKSSLDLPQLEELFSLLYQERPDLAARQAVGLIFLREKEGGFDLYPLVRVNQQKTTFYESSCGSGTIAAALACLQLSPNHPLTFTQPSGSNLEVSFLSPSAGDTVTLAGTVSILRKGSIDI